MAIKIDITTKIGELGKDIESLGESIISSIQSGIREVSKMVYNRAQQLAQLRLRTSLNDYLHNLKYEKIDDNIYIIYLLENSPAIKYEDGWEKYDMKPGFLNSSKAKTTKSGNKIFDVPFNIQPKVQSPAGQRIVDMRTAVNMALKDEAVTKKVKEYNEKSKGLNQYGKVTRFEGAKEYNVGGKKMDVSGLVQITPPGQKTGGKYFLFRRVSRNSKFNSWMHPGFKGAKIFDDLPGYAEQEIDKVLKSILG